VTVRPRDGVTLTGARPSEQESSSSGEPAGIGPGALLDGLDTGVLLLTRDFTIAFANAPWQVWLGAPVRAGDSVTSLLSEESSEVQEELHAVLQDGAPRRLRLVLHAAPGAPAGQRLEGVAHRRSDGIIIEARAESEDDPFGMQHIAQRLAEVTDMVEVLRTLCDIATRQCGGTGAAVLRVLGHHGEVVAAAGNLVPARGRSFELEGSLLIQAISDRAVASEVNYDSSGRPLKRAVPELALGPVIVAPLHAHGETLGVIAVARGVGDRPFRARDMERLRLLSDHAALAMHKSLLLLQAQSADRAKGRFLATMSHELRTPLTALAGYNELLADQVIGPMSDPQLDILERMRSVTAHLGAMIEEILSFTSLEEGRETVRPTEFLAEDLVRAATAVVEPLAQQKNLRLRVSLPSSALRMTSDIDKVRQILVNLLGNAVKFTDAGSVEVRLSLRGTSVRIDVTDTGIGIPDEELSRLFRPFSQVDTGLTRRHGGTGLGLYISRRLTTLLGGHIEVSSLPGTGSTFSVILPQQWAPPT
jgi:signal transduction histidine kinase